MIDRNLSDAIASAALSLGERLNSPPWQSRERPVLIASQPTLTKLGVEPGDYTLGLKWKLDSGAPPNTIYVTDLRTLTHEVVRVP